ncbi:MAG: tripartite tricarboxylate transporter substrate-binding protein [Beijerinckiaceae bacterium]
MQAGSLRVLGVASPERNPLYAGTPTIAESGYPGFAAVSWNGISAPAGTPPDIVAKLNDLAAKALHKQDIKKKLEDQGFVVVGGTPQAYGDLIRSEIAKWGAVITEAGIKAE